MIEIDIVEGFFVETESQNFPYEVKVHNGTISKDVEGQ